MTMISLVGSSTEEKQAIREQLEALAGFRHYLIIITISSTEDSALLPFPPTPLEVVWAELPNL
jgi:hypothetical protein